MRTSFPLYKQLDTMDCGPTCLRMIAKFYGRTVTLESLRKKSQYGKEGVSMVGLADTAESIGLKSLGAKLTFEQLMDDAPLPAVIHWNQEHYVVITPESTKKKVVIADPEKGFVTLKKEAFLKYWISTNENGKEKGIALLFEPVPPLNEFELSNPAEQVQKNEKGREYLFSYIKQHKAYFFQIFFGLILGSILQLIFPYLTQSIVDRGIENRNIHFIQIILIAQLMLLFSQTVIEFIRSRLLLHISIRINISLLSDFWSKLLRLPMQFFDSKHPGDILQRINDHQRIENFLTGTALNTVFSIISLVVLSIVLLSYNGVIFAIFFFGSLLYLIWIQFFLRFRRKLDYERFVIASRETDATMQLVYGMQEIKLNNAENTYRWAWESLQAELFKLSFKNLSLSQNQQMGAFFINQGKNILITFVAAKLVVEANLTLGMMLAIQYIVGQLNSPIEQLIEFTQKAQDAKISLERLNDIHSLDDEEPVQKHFHYELPKEQDIHINNLSFAYPGASNEPVLKNISLVIPKGKVTAIVGMSGSGKSTLVKLLLKFYDTYKGDIYLGKTNFRSVSPKFWRRISGAVMQNNFVFNGSIQKNIIVNDEKIDEQRLFNACQTANILSFIESLPLGFYTKVGEEGGGISGGQKQRLAIAKAVYKDPQFVFFDEATNSLDANNEKVIQENLYHFFSGKTAVVVAHRLSTVKSADKIVVLENGEIAEEGNHIELTAKRGKYYELVKNQLELGG